MVQSDAELTVAQRLGQLLDRGLLPAGGPAEAAERLIERLERPARVALLGLPGSGKSAILNLLTGAVVVPETLRLPTIIVQHGNTAQMLCTLTDGRTEVVPGSDLNDVLTLNPAMVTLEMDLPALKVISLLEVSAGPMEAEQRRAAIWASKRADILIWCTTSYLPKEQQVWEGMPDVVKDNGFLFLTKVDLLGSPEAAQGMLERVEGRAGEEFRLVLSISAKQARAAMPAGGSVDRELFRESGAALVITTIKSRVQAARRADTDMAELLLARHVEASGIVARRFAEPDGAVAPVWTPPPEVSAEPAVVAAPVPAEVEIPKAVEAPVSELVVAPEPALDPEPEIEPEEEVTAPLAASEPVAVPEPTAPSPSFTRMPAPKADPAPVEGRKRFSDRIKQMPVPEDAPAVPLRSTWKSKAETTAARSQGAEPAPEPAPMPVEARRRVLADDGRPQGSDPRARPVAAKPADPQDDDAMLARTLASVTSAVPEEIKPILDDVGPDDEDIVEDEAIIEAITEEGGAEEDRAEEDVSDIEATEDDLSSVEDDSPRWAERLQPADTSAPIERSARTQLFGSRKPAPATSPGPADRVRPTEPVNRVRAAAPRPPEPLRPATPSPEDLATPRIIATRDRPLPVAEPGEPPRRERMRIAARTSPAEVAAVAVAPVTVPAAEQDLLNAAIQQIVARSAELTQAVDPNEKIPVDMILDHNRETIEQVMALLGPARSAGLRRIIGDLGEIQDIVMLMKLEKGHAPADDALTLLLQIRRDLETLRAA